MQDIGIGDIVARKSYGGDIAFKVSGIDSRCEGCMCTLKGLLYRIEADSRIDDLIKKDARETYRSIRKEIALSGSLRGDTRSIALRPLIYRLRTRQGRILHIDSSAEFLEMCMNRYHEAKLSPIGKRVDEANQPDVVAKLLRQYRPDILVLTGHDGIKKDSANPNSLDNYRNSRYFIESVKIAREFQADEEKLFIFAGACQSYYEGIMAAGANFASSPGRILIHALDPQIISQKVAVTDSRTILSPDQIISLTKSGNKGIGGKSTKGHSFTI